MAKNETAYTKPSRTDTAFAKPSKIETTHTDSSKSDTSYVDVVVGGIDYNEPTITYNHAIINYNGRTKMAKYRDAYTAVTKNETSYA